MDNSEPTEQQAIDAIMAQIKESKFAPNSIRIHKSKYHLIKNYNLIKKLKNGKRKQQT